MSLAIEETRMRRVIWLSGVDPAIELSDDGGLVDGRALHAPTSNATPTMAPTI
jgi:hypothetical protein